jgi:hypothetical protein
VVLKLEKFAQREEEQAPNEEDKARRRPPEALSARDGRDLVRASGLAESRFVRSERDAI